jgi:hypothetical protein
MKHLMTAFACLFIMNMSAQTDWPWNPDADSDNIIGVEDLMALLTVFDSEFVLELPVSQPYTLALADAGPKTALQCAGYCHTIGGHIPMSKELMV